MREPLKSIKLCCGDSGWDVVVDDVVVSSASDLQWAAFDALLLAEIYDVSHVEIGDGVPLNAIEEGLRAHGQWDAADHELHAEVLELGARRSA